MEAVWVIAGSTGGIAAVGDFYGAFPHTPGVAFLYAERIQVEQRNLLSAIGHSNRYLAYSLAVGRHWLNPNHVLIAPAACKLQFTRQGEVYSVRDDWGTNETPNIDKLMMTMSGMIPSPAGAIIFSGTGKDGGEGLRALQAVGTRIWAQDPSSALSPSMPQNAVDLGLVQFMASPIVLAAEFMRIYPPR